MPDFIFLGHVFPSERRLQIKFTNEKSTTYHHPLGDFRVQYNGSRVMISVSKTNADLPFEDANALANDFARAFVDLMSFKTGKHFGVYIDECIEDGIIQTLAPENPKLGELATAVPTNSPEAMGTFVLEVLRRPQLYMALRDLSNAISVPYDAPISCARAIDAIRNMLHSGRRDQSPDSWETLRTTLNFTEAYLRFVTDRSKKPRHGVHLPIPASDFQELRERAWTVMNRYLEYLNRGETSPLPESDFPTL